MTKPSLALITQRLFRDDWILGWTVPLVERLAERTDRLFVFPLYGEPLPELDNVVVEPFGGDDDDSRWRKLWRLEKSLFRRVTSDRVDGLFIHQNHLYAPALYWSKLFLDGPTVLFRAHGQLPWSIRLGVPFVDTVLTSSPESFDYDTDKKEVLSQPIDLERFRLREFPEGETFRIVSAGRISPIKGYEVLIRALRRVREQMEREVTLTIYGEAATDGDEEYRRMLEELVREKGLGNVVTLAGSVPYGEMPEVYRDAHLFANTPVEDSALDKVVLEAMAVGRPVLTTNPKFTDILEPVSANCLAERNDPEDVAGHIVNWVSLSEKERSRVGRQCRRIIEERFSLNHFADEVVKLFSS